MKQLTCESCCESEDKPIPVKHHRLWQLFPLLGEVSCGLRVDEELRGHDQSFHFIYTNKCVYAI